MSSRTSSVTLGFQTNAGSNVTYFDLVVPNDGQKHQITELIGHATSGGNPVKVPDSFIVNEVQLADPGQMHPQGKVDINYPTGSSNHVGVATLTASNTNVNLSSGLGQLYLTVSN